MPLAYCSSSAVPGFNSSTVFCHHHACSTAVVDGCDPHTSQSMGASAGLGCDGWADEAEECQQGPRGMLCALLSNRAALLLCQSFISLPVPSSHGLSLPFVRTHLPHAAARLPPLSQLCRLITLLNLSPPSFSALAHLSFVPLRMFLMLLHCSSVPHPLLSSTSVIPLPFLGLSTVLQPRGILPWLHSSMKHVSSRVAKRGNVVITVILRMVGTQEAMEMRIGALGVLVEETRRALEEADKKNAENLRELRGKVQETRRALEEADKKNAESLRELRGQVEETRRALEVADRRKAENLRELRGQVEETRRALEEAGRRKAENLRELRGQVEETRRALEEADKKRVVDKREMRLQVEDRERELIAKLAAVKGALTTESEGVKATGVKYVGGHAWEQ
ncbi:unnamed protein product [Closterium sp. NIES-65]|nr:unnamed protein product [Closterium sp. NIES-65]